MEKNSISLKKQAASLRRQVNKLALQKVREQRQLCAANIIEALNKLESGISKIELQNQKLSILRDELKKHVLEKSSGLDDANEKLMEVTGDFKKSEKYLLDIGTSFKETQELAHVGSWRWDILPDKIILSDEAYRLFGWPAGIEINFEKYLNAVLPEERETVKKMVKDVLRENKSYEIEYRILRDGEVRVHHTSGKIYFDEVGNPVRIFGSVQDITERKKAEEKLRNLNAWQEAIFQGSRDAVFVSDSESRFVMVNHAACLITGYSEKELLQMTIPDLHEAQDLHAYLLFHDRIMGGEEILSEARILKKDGRKVDAEFNNKRIIISGINYMHTSARDISERKRAEEALYESEDRYRDLVENSFDLICTHDLEGNILSSNPVASRQLGYDHNSILSMNIRDIIAPEYNHEFEFYLSVIRRNGAASGLMTVQTKTGEKRIWEYSNSLRTEGVDKPIVRGMAHDITERKRAEESLRESEERFRSIYENNTIGLYRTTPDGKIILANPALVKLLGYSSFEELAARDLSKHGFERLYERKQFIEKIETDGEIKGSESAWIRKDGTTAYIRESARMIRDSKGSTLYYDGTVEDITERKLAEKSLKENKELFVKIFKSIPGLATLWKRNTENKILLVMANEGSYVESNGKISKFIGTEVEKFFINSPETAINIINTMTTGLSNHLIINTRLRTTGKLKWLYADYVRVTESLVLNIVQDITERETAREELQRNKEELHKLTQHLLSIREEERANIAREIHDDLGQMLTALKMDLAWLRREAALCDAPVQNKIDIMSGMVDSTIKTVQRLSAELRPGILDDLGLPAAIEWLTEEIQKRTNINFELNILPEDISLDESLSVNIFRIIQETLTNVVRHSKATIVKINLEIVDGIVYINISDNGAGIPLEKIHDSNSLGLIGIRERARHWNGTVDIKGKENSGTEVSIKLQIGK